MIQKSNLFYALLGVLLAAGLTWAAELQIPSTPDLETDAFENTKAAWQKAYDDLNGDITTGTVKQKTTLFHYTETLAHLYRQKGEMEEALRYLEDLKRSIPLLKKVAEETEDEDEKEDLLWCIARAHSTFAIFDMYDDAMAAAKLSPMTGQYNASEYLQKVATIIASKEPFDKVIPVLDEAIAAAEKLPSLFWRECGIRDVAELYARAGRLQKARELLEPLSPYGKACGLLNIADVLLKKGKDNPDRLPRLIVDILPLLWDAEPLAELVPPDDRADILQRVALRMVQMGKLKEGMQVFEKTSPENDPRRRDYFLTDVACTLIGHGNFNEGEAFVEKIESPTCKARVLMYLIREACLKSDIDTMKRLIPVAEPFLAEVEPLPHRLSHQFYLAAYKIRVGNEEEGRKMMDDLIDGPYPEYLDRDWYIHRAIYGLCYAGLYEEAVKKAETLSTPEAKASAYQSIRTTWLQNEKPEEFKKMLQHWEVLEEAEE